MPRKFISQYCSSSVYSKIRNARGELNLRQEIETSDGPDFCRVLTREGVCGARAPCAKHEASIQNPRSVAPWLADIEKSNPSGLEMRAVTVRSVAANAWQFSSARHFRS